MDYITDIRITEIQTNPYQPRRQFSEQALTELSQSIAVNGLIQPIIVRQSPITGYELLAGERRLRACKKLGWSTIPALVKDLSNSQMMEQAIIENLQREDLNPIEEALAFQKLVQHGLTHEDIGQQLGKSRPYISNSLRLLKLAPTLQEALIQGDISPGHARLLLPLAVEEQLYLLQEIQSKGWSVRQLEASLKNKEAAPKSKNIDPFLADAERQLQEKLGTRIQIQQKAGNQGSITIFYKDLDEYERIIHKLK
ncbi:ParB/RepB/Spo0J family partition protein [Streptococcus danieliae]|uniref:ParB/RepB/Spo0J family partition protein n=1 Tax=Streptococcus danieliae TaxID=747656 RepID=A0A7Z0M5P4_9STRE|nr:ParB/RepB/Spo0J family partition protein [Streptococcus danieliae]MBF0699146.1 ParB/RepB/Spo0J family partition protein [Streptococcus danieliae]NYS96322.1 ParB/RepB/Spo0J family partition protein [Streptococcus danieliae]